MILAILRIVYPIRSENQGVSGEITDRMSVKTSRLADDPAFTDIGSAIKQTWLAPSAWQEIA
ncbi:hypothetical protein [Bacillus litorisediminis]|uniref:hypothetical protein n=1 Tax=Bacillus litorisediminis TaxID=2922713 RepID=UPI001FAE1613|nr:hypothetical protein [Bacillus litorisediminis]